MVNILMWSTWWKLGFLWFLRYFQWNKGMFLVLCNDMMGYVYWKCWQEGMCVVWVSMKVLQSIKQTAPAATETLPRQAPARFVIQSDSRRYWTQLEQSDGNIGHSLLPGWCRNDSDILDILNNNVIGEFINFHILVRLVEKCENFRFA